MAINQVDNTDVLDQLKPVIDYELLVIQEIQIGSL